MPTTNQTVIATAGLISVGVGTINSIAKDKKPPSTRFLIGSGVAFLILSAMSSMGDGLGELAKGLALGVMTTVLLGDGGGVLSYLGEREIDTKKAAPSAPKGSDAESAEREGVFTSARVSVPNVVNGATYRSDNLAPFPAGL